MLDINKQRTVVRRKGDTGNFTPAWPGQKAAILIGAGQGRYHLVIPHPFIRLFINRTGGNISLDPQHAAVIEGEPIRAAEFCPLHGAFRFRIVTVSTPGEHQNIRGLPSLRASA